jgi:integrase
LATVDEGFEAAKEQFRRLSGTRGAVVYAKLTVRQIAELFAREINGKVAATTHEWYVRHLTGFCKMHPTLRVRDLLPFHLTQWLNSRELNVTTRRGAISAVKRALAWAVDEGLIPASPLAKVKRPKAKRREIPTEADAKVFVSAIKNKATLDLVTLLLETGARPGELSTATAAGFDPVARTLQVTGKTGVRVLVLTEAAFALVCRLADRRPAGTLLRTHRGASWNRDSMRLVFRRLREKTGVKNATPYAFRHLFGTLAIKNNVNPLLVASLMGHSDLKMLHGVYTHHERDTLRQASEQAGGRLMG